MLPKKFRLNLKTDFGFAVKGKKISGRYFNIFYRFGDDTEVKIGVATSKASFKKAVQRNRAKRLIFTAFANLLHKLPQRLNLIVMPRTDILKLDTMEVEKELKEALNALL